MNRKGLIIFVVLFWMGMSGISSAVNLGMMTGSKKGTYFQFGLNMMELGKKYGFDLHVYNSRGSVENVYAVYQRPKTQMGIVQSDVLAFVLKVKSNKTLKHIAKKTKMIFPLYNEEIHLLGKNTIQSFDGLEGKTVAIGKEGSGSYMTSKLLFEVSGVFPKELVPLGTDKALSRLKNGSIDAMFYVAGFPVKLLSENVSDNDGLHLVPITNKSITEFYPTALIPSNTYAWQPEQVHTVAVKAVLVSFDFRRNNCNYVGEFAGLVYENLDWLKQNGHPKWNSVDLDYPLKGWTQYDCVKKYLHASPGKAEVPMEKNPLLDAIKNIL
ncbi:MAG: TAXI family TRAP transporter solute-binding subunit [Desulfobacterales bacterium]|nr:TAXI family TRAP transporter solute-binding subunit [Desulfobacterales bacterium]